MSRFSWYENWFLFAVFICYLGANYIIFHKFNFKFEDFATTPSCLYGTYAYQDSLFKNLGVENVDNPSENLLWFVHVSDIHISHYGLGNGVHNFELFHRDTLPCIKPKFVVATGDLTESTRNILDSGQIEQEWKIYQNLIQKYAH